MYRTIPIIILLLVTKYSTSQPVNQNDYKVYSDFLTNFFEDSPPSLYVIQQIGIYPKIEGKTRALLKHPELDSLVNDPNLVKCAHTILADTVFTKMVLDKNITGLDSNVIFIDNFQVNTVLVSPETIKELFVENIYDGWTSFHNQYKNSSGLIKFSRIAYSKDKKLAVLYFERQNGELDGEGTLYILEQINGTWRIIYQSMLWVS